MLEEELRPQILNVIESFNSDIAVAAKDGLTMEEATALAGAITEAALKNIPSRIDRTICWKAMVDIMNSKFENGEL